MQGAVEARHAVLCNGVRVPLHPTGTQEEAVAGVRYRAWKLPDALHPTIPPHAPLVFDIVDLWTGRSIGGCTVNAVAPGRALLRYVPGQRLRGRSATGRALFAARAHAGSDAPSRRPRFLRIASPDYPLTLDLRRYHDRDLSVDSAEVVSE